MWRYNLSSQVLFEWCCMRHMHSGTTNSQRHAGVERYRLQAWECRFYHWRHSAEGEFCGNINSNIRILHLSVNTLTRRPPLCADFTRVRGWGLFACVRTCNRLWRWCDSAWSITFDTIWLIKHVSNATCDGPLLIDRTIHLNAHTGIMRSVKKAGR